MFIDLYVFVWKAGTNLNLVIKQKDAVNNLALYVEQEIVKITFQLEAIEKQVKNDQDLINKVYVLDNILLRDILTKILSIISRMVSNN